MTNISRGHSTVMLLIDLLNKSMTLLHPLIPLASRSSCWDVPCARPPPAVTGCGEITMAVKVIMWHSAAALALLGLQGAGGCTATHDKHDWISVCCRVPEWNNQINDTSCCIIFILHRWSMLVELQRCLFSSVSFLFSRWQQQQNVISAQKKKKKEYTWLWKHVWEAAQSQAIVKKMRPGLIQEHTQCAFIVECLTD